MASLTVTFSQDPDYLDILEMVKDVVQYEYENGGFEGYKPTVVISEDD